MAMLIGTVASAQSYRSSEEKEMEWRGSAADIRAQLRAWFNDTSVVSPERLVGTSGNPPVLEGYGSSRLSYSAGDDARALKGTSTLTYRVRLIAKDGGFKVVVHDMRIDGRLPESETCWIPCTPAGSETHERMIERVRHEAKWRQLGTKAMSTPSGVLGRITHYMITNPGRTKPPARP